MTTAFMTTEEVAQLKSGDLLGLKGLNVPIAESGTHLEEYYKEHGRWNYQGGVKGKFWEKVGEVVEILKSSNEWPFEPIEVSRDRKVLNDGHHRSNAAILAGWDKPIPVEVW